MCRCALLAAAVSVMTACATAGSGGAARPREPLSAPGHALYADEIARSSAATAFDAVQRLRPEFLRARLVTPMGAATPLVYVDGVRYGDLGALRWLNAREVAEIRRLSSLEAASLFGSGNGAGAIVVTTLNSRRLEQRAR